MNKVMMFVSCEGHTLHAALADLTHKADAIIKQRAGAPQGGVSISCKCDNDVGYVVAQAFLVDEEKH